MWCRCVWALAFSGDKEGSEVDAEEGSGARVVNSICLKDVAGTMRST